MKYTILISFLINLVKQQDFVFYFIIFYLFYLFYLFFVARLSSDNSFRRKLNDMIGGQANQMSKPVLRRSQTCDDENIYEQLPECDELI